jgi:PKD repeat protein
VLYGDSPVRIAFLKKILEEGPPEGLDPIEKPWARNYAAGKEDDYYLFYFGTDKPTKWTFELPEGKIFQAEVIDTWNMTIVPKGTYSGNFTIDLPGKPYIAVRILKVQPKQDYAIRLTRSAPGEKGRSEAKATVDKSEGIAPLTVKFSTPWKQKCHWDFGGTGSSTERSPVHTFNKPGIYTVTLTITDEDGASGAATLAVNVDRNSRDPVVKFGFAGGDYPKVTLHGGKITRLKDGTYDLGSGEPFTWIKVGKTPMKELERARSFTIVGWLKASSMKVGPGGNRILFSLQRNRSGIDLVHHADGGMRLAVNEWPDRIRNDSSNGKVQVGKWIFFAVTYDASKQKDNVCWYFGDESVPARLDRKTSYNNGSVDKDTGDLVIGNFNKTLQSAGLNRQFRGRMRGIQIYASRIDERGALSLDAIRKLQR